MSLNELLKAVTEAHEMHDAGAGASKYTKIAAIDDVVVNGKHYKVSFLTNKGSDKLVRVNLESTNERVSTFDHSDLLKSLNEKYGSPSDVEKKKSPMGSSLIRTLWYFPTTTIEVFYYENELSISYSQKQLESNL